MRNSSPPILPSSDARDSRGFISYKLHTGIQVEYISLYQENTQHSEAISFYLSAVAQIRLNNRRYCSEKHFSRSPGLTLTKRVSSGTRFPHKRRRSRAERSPSTKGRKGSKRRRGRGRGAARRNGERPTKGVMNLRTSSG